MDLLFTITLVFGGVVFLGLFLKRKWKYSTLPPGPPTIPVLGNLLQPDPKRPFLKFSEWDEKYGEVYTLWNFNKPMVLCNGYESMYEMLVSKSNEFAGRPQQYVASYLSFNGNDITVGDFSPEWAYRKKIFMTSLKMYGEGLKHLEDLMADIIDELINNIDAKKQKPFDPKKDFEYALAGVLSLLLLGTKFEQDDPDLHQLLEYNGQMRQLLRQSSIVYIYNTFPWLHYLPLAHSKMIDTYVNGFVKGWIQRQIQKVKLLSKEKTFSSMVGAILKQQEKGGMYELSDQHVTQMARNVFGGGMNTSTSTLYILFANLTVKQDIQDKAREEVDRVLHGQRPKLKDRENMPYIQAIMEEVLRLGTIIYGQVHKTMKDTTLQGYLIPKGTTVLPNTWHLFHDPKVWTDPFDFKPERFLDSNGQFLPIDHPTRKWVVAFGAGRRVCPGEHLARNRVFLIATSLLQKFVFKPAADDQLPKSDPRTYIFGLQIMPQPYQLRAVPRSCN